jgi:hypothetical protein
MNYDSTISHDDFDREVRVVNLLGVGGESVVAGRMDMEM